MKAKEVKKSLDDIREEITKIRVRVYSGQSLEDTDADLYNLELFVFKKMDDLITNP